MAGASTSPASKWPALAGLAGLALLWTVLAWALGRGFDPTDEAYYLVQIGDPGRYLSVSDFAQVLSPLNRLVGGDIVGLRLIGAVILQASGLVFGFAVVRFAGIARRPGQEAMAIGLALAIAANVVWMFGYWKTTPNYNTATLCGLMMVLSGLMAATPGPGSQSERRPSLAPAILVGLGLALCALVKASSATAALGLCLVWLITLRPSRPFLAVAISGLVCASVLTAAILLTGGFEPYLGNKLLALHRLSQLDTQSSVSGRLAGALVRPVARENWGKLLAIAPFLATLAALGIGWCGPLATPRRIGTAFGYLCAGLLGLCALWWRAADVWDTQRTPGYLAWCFVTLAPLAATSVFFVIRARPMTPGARRALTAAALLAATPFVYAFGTDVVIPFHAAGAAIFWLAALAILVGEASPLEPARLRPGLVALALASAFGLMGGVIVTPGPAGPHLWLQTQPTAIGRSGSRVALDGESAAYYAGLRQAAARNGFRPGTTVADLAGLNDGMILAIGGRPAALTVVPQLASNAARPWVLDSPSPGKFAGPVDLAGARFPQDYMLVGQVVHRGKGWTVQLWKPKNG